MAEHRLQVSFDQDLQMLKASAGVELCEQIIPGLKDAQRAEELKRMEALEGAAELLQRAAAELSAVTQKIATEVQDAVIELSLALIKKVLAQDVEGGRFRVTKLVESLLVRVPELSRNSSTLKLSKADADRLSEELKEHQPEDWESIEIESDPALSSGQFSLQTPHVVMQSDWRRGIEKLEEVLVRDERETSES